MFNISKARCLVRIPLEMISDRSISFATKMLYGLMVMYAGSAGYFSLAQERFASDMGVSIILIRKAVAGLKKKKYIMVKGGGHGKPSIYYFF
ncbi:MAG: hypothetical protein MUP22_09795 [Desulfobacterales bacterium]|nr:hypothetical protein [Desulfobacterales bacterium]